MAKQALNTIKSWFKRGAKPTQQQFSDAFDSFVHKDDLIPQEKIENFADTINYMQHDVDNAFANSIEEVKVNGVPLEKDEKSVNIEIGQSQADWEQNDEDADGYVKGRTHYEEKTEVISMEISGSDDRFEWPFTPEQGETYKLTYIENDTEKTAYGTMSDVSPTQEHINFGSGVGAVYHIKGSNEGFWSGFATVESITVEKVDIHTLPEKYIPESIARKSELANVAHTGDYEDLENKPSIPDAASMIATHNAAQDAHNDIRQMALGAMRGQSYADIETMVTALNALPADSFRVGDNIYLDQLNVPDVWISAVNGSSTTYTYVDDSTFTAALSAGRVQVGYFSISQLETEDVVLNPATTSENGLMSAADKQKLESMVHNATRVQITGFKESGGNVIGSIYIWNTPRQGGYYGSLDVNLQIRIPMITVNGNTVGFNENYNFDITGPIESLIHSIIGDRIDPQITTLHNRITDEATARNDADNAIYTEIVMPHASTSTALSAGVFADLGTLTENKTLTLPTIEAGKVPEFNGQFTVDANGDFSVTFPNGVTMVGETTQEAGVTYQFSICNGYGVIVKMA